MLERSGTVGKGAEVVAIIEQEAAGVNSGREPARQGASARALIIGSIGVGATAVLVTYAELVLKTLHIGYLQFPPVSLGLLLIVVALGRGMKRLQRRWGLSPSDLLVIYSMMLVAAMVSSHGIVQKWIPLLVAPNYYADATNNWKQIYFSHIPHWLVPWDPRGLEKQDVAKNYYDKLPRGEAIPWDAWILPVMATGILVLLVIFAFLCLTTIIRRQWMDNEKLSFPLAQLPLEIASDEEGGTFFRNRLMWLGALVPVAVYCVKEWHLLQPTVPDVTVQWNLSDYVTTLPWSAAAGGTAFILSFAAIGFFFLLPTDVLFSIWFFFLLTRLEQLMATVYNMDTPGMPIYPPPLFVGYQTVGAYLVLVGYFFWIARPHLKKVWAAALGREKVDDSGELLPYRVAVWGLLASIALSAVWLWVAGMSLWLAVFELVIFLFVIALVMTRSTAEAGMMMTETTFRPIDLYRMIGPVHGLGAANLTMLAFFDNMFLRDQRGLLLTGMLDSTRLAAGTRVNRRAFAGVLALGIGLALLVAVPLNIYFPYHLGAAGHMDNWMETGSPLQTFQNYQPYFSPTPPSEITQAWQMPTFFTIGVLVTIFLTIMRAAFFWWPLHPLGYALSGSWSTIQFWFACFLAWMFKSLFLRYGGMGFYVKARPFFLGMVLGEFGSAVVFTLINVVSGGKIPAPAFPWG